MRLPPAPPIPVPRRLSSSEACKNFNPNGGGLLQRAWALPTGRRHEPVRMTAVFVFSPQSRGLKRANTGHYAAQCRALACGPQRQADVAPEQVTNEPEEPARAARQRGEHG